MGGGKVGEFMRVVKTVMDLEQNELKNNPPEKR